MDILELLPHDLQERVYKHYSELERIRNLQRQRPLSFALCYSSQMKDLRNKSETYNNSFSLFTSIECDKHNMVWCKFEIDYRCWRGCPFNIDDLPLMHIRSEDDIKKLVVLWKKVFVDFIRYNYIYGEKSFEDVSTRWYEIDDTKFFSMSQRTLCQVIKKKWFREVIKEEDIDIYNMKRKFRIMEEAPGPCSEDMTSPFSYKDLTYIQEKLPTMYLCLENNNQLWSPYIKWNESMKEYIKLLIAYEKANDTYHEQYGTIEYKKPFMGYDGFPDPEEFNERVGNLLDKISKRDLRIYCGITGYISLPSISTIIQWYNVKSDI
jgi:hypothetical protein